MKNQFDYVTHQIKTADTVPALLASALAGLELLGRATTLLTQHTRTGSPSHPSYQDALAEITKAFTTLTEAPTLARWPDGTSPDSHHLRGAITALVLVVAQAVLSAASKTPKPGDRVAC
ncbi:hypothetical protein ACFQ07_04340, partial [Actinomadura adrarensis]